MSERWLRDVFESLQEREALKNHIKEQALHGKCLSLNQADTKRLSVLLEDYRDTPQPPKDK